MTFTKDDTDHAAAGLDNLERMFGETARALFVVAAVTAYTHPEWVQWWGAILQKGVMGEPELEQAGLDAILRILPVPGAAR